MKITVLINEKILDATIYKDQLNAQAQKICGQPDKVLQRI